MPKVLRCSHILILLLAVAFSFSCASSEPKSDFELDVDDDEISVAISEAVARGLVEDLIGANLECEGGADGQMRALLETLDDKGPRGHASYRDGETTVEGRRRGRKFDIVIRGAGSGRIEATMPWAVAECMLGNTISTNETISSSIKVTVTNNTGRNFSFKLQ
jgi:hypothetical protein